MVTRNRELSYSIQEDSSDPWSTRKTENGSRARSRQSRTSSSPIRILIIENHRVVADALKALFNEQPGLVVVGTLGSVAEARSYIVQGNADVLIADHHLTDGTGAEAVQALRQKGCQAPMIVLTHDDGDAARLAAVQAGASAFLLKADTPMSLIDAIRRVAAGAYLMDPSTIASLLRKSQEMEAMRGALTPREKEVLRMVGEGLPTREIASRLGISYTTVRTYIRSVARKLGAHGKIEAVLKARQLALVE